MSNFETWWEHEGQEFLYALNTTTDDDIKLVAEIAWKNGAYCAEQAEQEPVATLGMIHPDWFEKVCEKCSGNSNTPLYTHPVRTKDLTDDEIWKLYGITGLGKGMALRFARAVIDKLREKERNHG